jgi:CHAT domain-containing protein
MAWSQKTDSIMLISTTMIKTCAKLILIIFSAHIVSGCAAMDPLTMIAAPKRDHQQEISLKQANYRVQKKYDLLEKSFLKEYERHSNGEHVLGQLYTTVDLAEFYTYDLINYEKAEELFLRADKLNDKCKELKFGSDGPEITYYNGGGAYLIPRKYDFHEIGKRICDGKKHITRLLGGDSEGLSQLNDTDRAGFAYPEIINVTTNQYAHAIQVRGTLLAPTMFDGFEQKLLRKTKEYFQLRHKLSESEKTYYIYYNVAKGLIKANNFSFLSISQANTIFQHIRKASANRPSKTVALQEAYLNFGKVLCLNKMRKHDEAIKCFEKFQSNVTEVQDVVNRYIASLKEAKSDAISRGTGKTAAFLIVDILTISLSIATGFPIHTNLTASGILDLGGNIPDLQRQIALCGESEYSQDLNLVLNMDDQLQLFRAVGDSYHHMGNTSQSIIYNKEGINIINNLRSTIASESGRIGYAAFKDGIYNQLIDDLITSNKLSEAFVYSEMARSRALVDLLGSKTGIVFKDAEVNNYVNKARKGQIYRDMMLEGIAVSDEQANHINSLQRSLSTDRGIVVKPLSEHEDGRTIFDRLEALSLITVPNLTVSQIQSMIPNGITLVEYYVSNNDVYAWVLSNETFKSHALETTPDKLIDSLRRFNLLIRYPKAGSSLKEIKLAGQALYNILFSSVEQHIKTKQILIVAHRFLHFLPFEVLYDAQQFLVERYSFSYLPSSSVLQFLKPEHEVLESCLLLGNPDIDYIQNITSLEGAEKETISIGKIFAIQKVYLKRKATETVFRREAWNYGALHLACHGLFDSADPLNSRILLTRDNENDGILTAREIYGTQLNASLVTLSACESGMASVENGDELVGLVRGFLFAGASSVLASLWKVDDIATLEIMYRFYRYLICDRKPTAKAIQLAQIDLMKSKEYNHPFFWAPFRLYSSGL